MKNIKNERKTVARYQFSGSNFIDKILPVRIIAWNYFIDKILPVRIARNLGQQTTEHDRSTRGHNLWKSKKKLHTFLVCFGQFHRISSRAEMTLTNPLKCISIRMFFLIKLLINKQQEISYGSGVYMGVFACRMYCVEWKTRKASPAKKSRDDNKPATGLNVKPVQSVKKSKIRKHYKSKVYRA